VLTPDIHITAAFAALFAIFHVIFTLRVGGYRFKSGISLGDGGDKELLNRIRAHGNFTEQVPIGLLILLLNELNRLSETALVAMGSVFLAARLLHYIMIVTRSLPIILRPISMMATLGTILTGGVLLLL